VLSGSVNSTKAKYRKFIRTLSDAELVKAGKRLRVLCGDVVHALGVVSQFENLILFWSRGIHKKFSLKASSLLVQKAINLCDEVC
jgi:hypothetical protein